MTQNDPKTALFFTPFDPKTALFEPKTALLDPKTAQMSVRVQTRKYAYTGGNLSNLAKSGQNWSKLVNSGQFWPDRTFWPFLDNPARKHANSKVKWAVLPILSPFSGFYVIFLALLLDSRVCTRLAHKTRLSGVPLKMALLGKNSRLPPAYGPLFDPLFNSSKPCFPSSQNDGFPGPVLRISGTFWPDPTKTPCLLSRFDAFWRVQNRVEKQPLF